MSDNIAYAKSKPNGGNNEANQGISERQSSEKKAQCVAGGSIVSSRNNQGTQGQSSEKKAQCISGEEATVSCNNTEFHEQVNSDNRVLDQD